MIVGATTDRGGAPTGGEHLRGAPDRERTGVFAHHNLIPGERHFKPIELQVLGDLSLTSEDNRLSKVIESTMAGEGLDLASALTDGLALGHWTSLNFLDRLGCVEKVRTQFLSLRQSIHISYCKNKIILSKAAFGPQISPQASSDSLAVRLVEIDPQ